MRGGLRAEGGGEGGKGRTEGPAIVPCVPCLPPHRPAARLLRPGAHRGTVAAGSPTATTRRRRTKRVETMTRRVETMMVMTSRATLKAGRKGGPLRPLPLRPAARGCAPRASHRRLPAQAASPPPPQPHCSLTRASAASSRTTPLRSTPPARSTARCITTWRCRPRPPPAPRRSAAAALQRGTSAACGAGAAAAAEGSEAVGGGAGEEGAGGEEEEAEGEGGAVVVAEEAADIKRRSPSVSPLMVRNIGRLSSSVPLPSGQRLATACIRSTHNKMQDHPSENTLTHTQKQG